VHAVRDERERYRPLRSEIVSGSDPVQVDRAFREALGLDELYVADLDAIDGRTAHRQVLAALVREARVMVDAGVTEVSAVRRLLELGAAHVVIGTETLADRAAIERLRAELPDAPLVLSLDLRACRVISSDPELARLEAAEALARLRPAGIREVIVLDLTRVGADAGPDVALVRELHGRFPELELLAGGGVRDLADLRALAAAGAAGALVATALHCGAIGRDEMRAVTRRPSPNALSARPPRPPRSCARRPASRGCR
jgi:phosphoribosylformimino-5-aminoimidazole carboxamide ribotide isomerase